MAVSKEERNRILSMVAARQVSVEEAAQLFDALVEETTRTNNPPVQVRTMRIWITDMATRSRKVNMTATLPVNLLRISLHSMATLVPSLRDGRVEQVLHSLEHNVLGRVLDLQNLEDGQRVEIFIEK